MPKYQPNSDELKQIDAVFSFHPVQPGQAERYEALRAEAKAFAASILEKCPSSRERTVVLRKLQEVVMYANAAIAINEKADDGDLRVV